MEIISLFVIYSGQLICLKSDFFEKFNCFTDQKFQTFAKIVSEFLLNFWSVLDNKYCEIVGVSIVQYI